MRCTKASLLSLCSGRDQLVSDDLLAGADKSLVGPSIAIVVPSKNREDDILRCLGSIRLQAAQPDQIIVIDQSPRPYRIDAFSDVLHVHEPKLTGLTAARNYAIQFVRTQIVLFLDDDVELLDDCVTALRREFTNRPDAVAIGCSIISSYPLSVLGRLRATIFERGFFNRAPIRRRTGWSSVR